MKLDLSVCDVVYFLTFSNFDDFEIILRDSVFGVIARSDFECFLTDFGCYLDYRVDSFTWESEGYLYIDINYPYPSRGLIYG